MKTTNASFLFLLALLAIGCVSSPKPPKPISVKYYRDMDLFTLQPLDSLRRKPLRGDYIELKQMEDDYFIFNLRCKVYGRRIEQWEVYKHKDYHLVETSGYESCYSFGTYRKNEIYHFKDSIVCFESCYRNEYYSGEYVHYLYTTRKQNDSLLTINQYRSYFSTYNAVWDTTNAKKFSYFRQATIKTTARGQETTEIDYPRDSAKTKIRTFTSGYESLFWFYVTRCKAFDW